MLLSYLEVRAYDSGTMGIVIQAASTTARNLAARGAGTLLVVEPDAAIARVGDRPDRIEREGAAFHRRVAAAYLELAERWPDRIVVLDATSPPEELAERIHGAVRSAA